MELLESWRERFATRPHFKNRWPGFPDAQSFDDLVAELAIFWPVDAADLLCVMVLAFVDLVRHGTMPGMVDHICYRLDMGRRLTLTNESAVVLHAQFSVNELIGLREWLEWLVKSFPEEIPGMTAADVLHSWKIRGLLDERGHG